MWRLNSSSSRIEMSKSLQSAKFIRHVSQTLSNNIFSFGETWNHNNQMIQNIFQVIWWRIQSLCIWLEPFLWKCQWYEKHFRMKLILNTFWYFAFVVLETFYKINNEKWYFYTIKHGQFCNIFYLHLFIFL
jgi:hypothetical protein